MKKLFAIVAAALFSVATFASREVVPSDADLAAYATKTYTMCIYNESACNDIVLIGTYVGWSTSADLEAFEPVEGFEGWYVVSWDDETDPSAEGGIQAKPVQLDGSGNFSWDYQLGADAELIRGTADLSTHYNEIDIRNIGAGIIVIDVKSWKNDPCALVYHVYNITLVSPDCNPEDYVVPAISGSFNNWAQQAMTMNELKTAERQQANLPGAVFEYNVKAAEGSEFKFRSSEEWGKDWSNQLKEYDEELGEFQSGFSGAGVVEQAENGILVLGETTDLVFDLSDPEKYLWDNCEKPEPCDEETKHLVVVGINPPAGVPETGIEIIGTFDDWIGTAMELNPETGWYLAVLSDIIECAEFKFREAGTWDNEIVDAETGKGLDNIKFKNVKGWGVDETYKGEPCYMLEINLSDGYVWKANWPISKKITKTATNGSISGPSEEVVGSSVTLTAIPNYGYHFTQWSDGITDNPRTFKLTQDTTFTAEFAKNEYTITTASNNPEWGTTVGDTTALYLEEVEIAATANYGYHFARWNDYNTSNPRIITIHGNTTYTAIFEKNRYYITKQVPEGGGYIAGTDYAAYLDNVTLEAIPYEGYHFTQWSDGNTDNLRTFVLTQDTTFTAEFAVNTSGLCGDNLVWSMTDGVLTIIGTGAMWDGQPWRAVKEQITQVGLPQGLTSIGNRAFENCASLTALSIPNTVNYVGNYAFSGCNNISSFEGPAVALAAIPQNKVQSIIVNGGLITNFYINDALKRLDLAAAENTSLRANMLNGYVDLEELVLPANLEYIDYMTVAGCLELKGIVIPASVKEIDRRAFEDCRSLSSLTFEEGSLLTTIGAWAFYNCHELANIDIPEGVIEIGKAAFYGCTYAQAAHLPASVHSIGDNAFALCSKLQRMDVDAVEPPAVEDKTFFEVSTETPIYVPEESVDTYKAHSIWGKLNIVGKSNIPQGTDEITHDQLSITKILRNGQILILRGDKTYTTIGQLVR